ncbi:MAG TPA: hypothetical protein VGD37_39655 [Kofleriaceae bacterium]|jgi:hypothetical protein
MTRSNSFLHNSLVSMTLIAGGVAATGCVDPAEPATGSVQHTIISNGGASPVSPLGEVRVTGDRVSLASAGWTQTDPGIWTSSSKTGTGSIVIGAEGHQRAIARAETDLAALRAGGGSPEALQQQEAYLDNLKSAAEAIATQGVVPFAVSCNIGFVIGPSSPIIPGFIGAFAGAQLVCTGGTQVFTVQAQACTNFGCGPVSTFTPTIGATPQLFGTATAGTAGAACFGIAAVTPPGVSASASGPCG